MLRAVLAIRFVSKDAELSHILVRNILLQIVFAWLFNLATFLIRGDGKVFRYLVGWVNAVCDFATRGWGAEVLSPRGIHENSNICQRVLLKFWNGFGKYIKVCEIRTNSEDKTKMFLLSKTFGRVRTDDGVITQQLSLKYSKDITRSNLLIPLSHEVQVS